MEPTKITYEQSVFNRLDSLKPAEEIKYDPAKGKKEDWEKFLSSVRNYFSSDYWIEIEGYVVRKVAKEKEERVKFSDDDWSDEIKSLEEFFSSAEIPTEPIMLNEFSKIVNVQHFIDGHISFCKNNNGKKVFKGYLDRLRELKLLLSAENGN